MQKIDVSITTSELLDEVTGGKTPLFYDAETLEKSTQIANSAISPNFVKKQFDTLIDNDCVQFLNSTLQIKSKSLSAFLEKCSSAVLFCATLGHKADAELEKAKAKDMQTSVLLDTAFLVLIEKACDKVCELIQKEMPQKKITSRFSLGYGDSPMDAQKDFLRLLDAEKQLGVLVNDGGMMIPSKTVSAIVGIYS